MDNKTKSDTIQQGALDLTNIESAFNILEKMKSHSIVEIQIYIPAKHNGEGISETHKININSELKGLLHDFLITHFEKKREGIIDLVLQELNQKEFLEGK